MEERLFRNRGIDIKLKFAGQDGHIFASVVIGSVLYGIGDPIFAAIAKERGVSGHTNNPGIPIINRPEDSAGMGFGSLPSPSTTFWAFVGMYNQEFSGPNRNQDFPSFMVYIKNICGS